MTTPVNARNNGAPRPRRRTPENRRRNDRRGKRSVLERARRPPSKYGRRDRLHSCVRGLAGSPSPAILRPAPGDGSGLARSPLQPPKVAGMARVGTRPGRRDRPDRQPRASRRRSVRCRTLTRRSPTTYGGLGSCRTSQGLQHRTRVAGAAGAAGAAGSA